VDSEPLEQIRRESEWVARVYGGQPDARRGAGADPAAIARAMGVSLAQRSDATSAYRMTRGGRHVIVLPPIERPERKAFTIAHEIGEIHLPTSKGFAPPEREEPLGPEFHVDRAVYQGRVHEAAVWFAMFLLVPECDALVGFDPHLHELAGLKPEFPLASHEVLALRVAMRSDGRVTITDNGRQTRRTGFGPWSGGGADWHPTERRVHEAVAQTGQTCRLTDQGLRVAGFAVFEPAVRRIILLSHLDEVFQDEYV
jgi:hypothetical protein